MNKSNELKKVAEEVAKCESCPLYKGANPVFGDGNVDANIVFIGEAPGFHEDRLGLPFVGASGKLLDKGLASIGMERKDVFIGNMIKHRPPENRDPTELELAKCSKYIERQIEIIKPKLIVTLGRFSMAMFFPNVKISQVHGQPRWVVWKEKKLLVMPFYHPAAALRRGLVMKEFMGDFDKMVNILKMMSNSNGSKKVKEKAEKKETDNKKNEKGQLSLI